MMKKIDSNDKRRSILIATGNPGKYREMAAILSEAIEGGAALPVRWLSLLDIDERIPEPVEDGQTFGDNALLKARYYSRATGYWTLADDSGLMVDALGGSPGVRSARFAGCAEGTPREAVYQANNEKLAFMLKGVPYERRKARFWCAACLADGDRLVAAATGGVDGHILETPRGDNGFGYDPYFYVDRLGKTMAELSLEEKNRISHRGDALRRFREVLAGLFRDPQEIEPRKR